MRKARDAALAERDDLRAQLNATLASTASRSPKPAIKQTSFQEPLTSSGTQRSASLQPIPSAKSSAPQSPPRVHRAKSAHEADTTPLPAKPTAQQRRKSEPLPHRLLKAKDDAQKEEVAPDRELNAEQEDALAKANAAAEARERALSEVDAEARAPAVYGIAGQPYWTYFGGEHIDNLLEHTSLIDVQYLIDLAEGGGRVPKRQEIPEAALITPRTAWRLRLWAKAYSTAVFALSYAWLDWYHPDRLGVQLRMLLPVFRVLLAQATEFSPHATVGVLWDYACLPQKPFANQAENDAFKTSLGAINEWYFHPFVTVLLATSSVDSRPGQKPYSNLRPHENRGWCFFEKQASMVTKDDNCLWDISEYKGGTNVNECREQMKVGRSAPLDPVAFAEQMRSRVQLSEKDPNHLRFTSKADMDRVVEQYKAGFIAAFSRRAVAASGDRTIFYLNLGWDDAEGQRLLASLKYAAENCAFAPDEPLSIQCFEGNSLSDEMKASLKDLKGQFLVE